jgi:probable HAF family extracellular repeat protein
LRLAVSNLNTNMRIDGRIAVQALLLCSLVSIAFGAGVTYPDGTVSPFPPAFIPAGIPRGEEISGVYGVAAKDGVILGAVGFGSDASGNFAESVLFLIGTGGITILEVEPGKAGDVAYGISGDGKFKVGAGGYWDEQNHFHKLPDAGFGAGVGSISRDGSTIGGDVATEDSTGQQHPVVEATLWATGGTGLTRVGFLPDFQSSSYVNGVSADGQNVCGISIRAEDPSRSIPGLIQAFALRQGGPMQRLPGLAPNVDTYASGISNYRTTVVGTSDGRPVAWTLENDHFVAAALKSDYGGEAVAIDDNGFDIVGHTYTADGEYTAVLWEGEGFVPGTIKGLLANTYKRSIGKWDLLEANCISDDGYTVGGQGINPDGKYEGYVAVLPPILHPPILLNPGPRHANVAEPFVLKIDTKNPDPEKAPTFTARGLPKGFGIDSSGFISGVWFADQATPGTYTVTVTGKNSEGSGTTTFNLTLPAPPSDPANNKVIEGHGFLQLNKAPGETAFPASFSGGISANGQVAVGHDGIGNDSRAYRWTQTEGISGLPMLVGALRDYGTALAASSDGNTIVGQAAAAPADDGSNRSVAMVWKTAPASAKTMKVASTTTYAVSETVAQLEATNIGLFPGGIVSIANAVSADGSVVIGYGDATEKGVNYEIFQAFRWTSGSGMVNLGWLPGGRKFSEAFGLSPDGSTIVGVSDSATGNQAFRWTQTEGMVGIGKLPDASFTRANAISANNSVIIGYGTISGNNHAFRWTAAEGLVDLGVLPGDQFSEATAISADGSIIVGRSGIFPSSRPFIWDKANGMRDLKGILVAGNPNLSDWTLKTADGISADGKIVAGSGKNPAGDSEGTLQRSKSMPPSRSTFQRACECSPATKC